MSNLLQKELGVVERSYYEASARRAPPAAPLADRLTVDVCVVGGGYAGLSCALELAARGYTVAVLEAQRIGWGASGRNGGQAIVGFGAEGEHAIEHQLAPDAARAAWDASVEGLTLLHDRIHALDIDCDYVPGYLTVALNARRCRTLERWAKHVETTYRYPLEWIDHSTIGTRIESQRFVAGVHDARSGHLHPLKYCLGLATAARHAGIRIYENSAAFRLERGAHPIVKTAEGSVRCNFVVLAGNVYLGEYGDALAPEIGARIMPVGTYMIATEPMHAARANALLNGRPAVSDNNLILDYFRLSADHRLLFGAGETYNAKTPRNLVRRMRARMLRVFPQLADLRVQYAWGGFVDITLNRAPHLGRLGTNIYFAQGFSGHGLVFTGMAGKLIAEAIAGQAERFDVFSGMRHLAFPGGAWFRTPALALGMWYYSLRDLL